MADKPYHEMTDAELHDAMLKWGGNVDNSTGWPSAYFAAKQCAAIEVIAKGRGLNVANNWPITHG